MDAYAIVAPRHARQAGDIFKQAGLGDVQIRPAETGQGAAALEEAARVPAGLLLLDVDTGPGLGPAVLRYRLARPQARVILLAAGKEPGDPEVARVVQAGVYDVVTALEDLAATLARPPATLAQAALWLDPSLAPDAAQAAVRERVIERRVPMSTRPVLILVYSCAPGAGATTAACSLAGYLARQGFSSAVVSVDGAVAALAGEAFPMPDAPLPPGPRRWLPKLDYYITQDYYDAVRAGKYQYVVVDRGHRPRREACRALADLVIVSLPPLQRMAHFILWRREYPEVEGSMLYVTLGGAAAARELSALLLELGDPHGVYPLPARPESARDWPPGWSRPDRELDEACRAVLAGVTPSMPGRGLFGWRRKR